MKTVPILAALLLAAAGTAEASCTITIPGTRCERPGTFGQSSGSIVFQSAPGNARTALQTGAALPDDARMLMNPDYYGLPPVDGPWRYYVVDGLLYKVDSERLEILEQVDSGNRQLW